jgi:hypothetical protein
VRIGLVLLASGLVALFAVALWLDPYEPDGKARRLETHRQLGLPPCTFRVLTGLPCPSCGLTTSFALFVRGDVVNSARANWVGTLLAAFLTALVPWSFASAVCGRLLGVWSAERLLTLLVGAFIVLLLVRWLLVLGLHENQRSEIRKPDFRGQKSGFRDQGNAAL